MPMEAHYCIMVCNSMHKLWGSYIEVRISNEQTDTPMAKRPQYEHELGAISLSHTSVCSGKWWLFPTLPGQGQGMVELWTLFCHPPLPCLDLLSHGPGFPVSGSLLTVSGGRMWYWECPRTWSQKAPSWDLILNKWLCLPKNLFSHL